MKVLVACEESQEVTMAMRRLGIIAFSCDLQPTSGPRPDFHIQQDVKSVLDLESWYMIIAFPPCTHLASSGARWFKQKREDGRQQKAIDFFMLFANLDNPYVAIENPIGIMSTQWRKPDQIIHPWQFGHPEKKSTCLWLKGLPPLKPTNNVYDEMLTLPKSVQNRIHYMPPSKNRSKLRSKTYRGIANAMAEQWGKLLLENQQK
jgi:site-specific DNA-cytosine methylase